MRSRPGVVLTLMLLLLGLMLPATTSAAGTLDQSQETVAGTCGLTDSPGEYRPVAQIFTAGITGVLTKISLWPGADWAAQDVTIEIRTVSGSVPSTTVLASRPWNSSESGQFVDMDFKNGASLTDGEKYAIVVARSAGVNGLQWGCASNPYPGGHQAYYLPNTTTWEADTFTDRAFRTYVSVPVDVQIYLSGTGEGANGSVTSNPAGIDCGATCLAQFLEGTQLTITAEPAVGASFGSWLGGPCNHSTDPVCDFTVPAQNVEMEAAFYGIPTTAAPTVAPTPTRTPRPSATTAPGGSISPTVAASAAPSGAVASPADSGLATDQPTAVVTLAPGATPGPTAVPSQPAVSEGGPSLLVLLLLVIAALVAGGAGMYWVLRRRAGAPPPASPPASPPTS